MASSNQQQPVEPGDADVKAVGQLRKARERLRQEIGRVIVGQGVVLDNLLAALLCRGHALMVGVPGLGKTLMAKTIAHTLQMTFNRIQFTPDLMPSDIIGTDVIEEDPETGRRRLEFIQGPLFTHFLLADEINRAPPKTQSALLQAMQEQGPRSPQSPATRSCKKRRSTTPSNATRKPSATTPTTQKLIAAWPMRSNARARPTKPPPNAKRPTNWKKLRSKHAQFSKCPLPSALPLLPFTLRSRCAIPEDTACQLRGRIVGALQTRQQRACEKPEITVGAVSRRERCNIA